MNIHINKTTRFQSWEGKTIFGEYPVHIRPGNFTVTLIFHDQESIERLSQLLNRLWFKLNPDRLWKKSAQLRFHFEKSENPSKFYSLKALSRPEDRDLLGEATRAPYGVLQRVGRGLSLNLALFFTFLENPKRKIPSF